MLDAAMSAVRRCPSRIFAIEAKRQTVECYGISASCLILEDIEKRIKPHFLC